ncbi:MAG: molybdate ABC transporter permease subunit [Symploca sp. SIO2C1]|nr:molybdate ABC transporter permease subunit [Symploca sp. SIO2C1]
MPLDLSPLWISLKTATVATIFAFLAGIMVAGWMFGYRGKGKGLMDGLFTLPLVLPPTVVGFLLLLLLGKNSPLGQLLYQWEITLIFSWPAAVIAATVVAFPLMYKTVLGAFEQVNRDLINCARTLGASEWRIFWEVLLPLAWPGVIAGTILTFARALGEFGATLMLAGSIPGKTQTMPIAIFFAAEAGKMDEALLWVLVVVAIALIAITGINYLSNSPSLGQTRLVTYWSFLINRWSSILGYRLYQHRTEKRLFLNQEVPLLTINNNQGIIVNLQKKIANFTLETNFVAQGKPLGILGASGSGKSMTLRCLAGLEMPNQGRIVLNGRVLFDSAQGINLPSRERRIGFVFQNYALFPQMRVARNIEFGLQDLSKKERKQRVSKYIELMQLQGLERRYPHELSGGQQQRVALARALAIEPEALLLDEPLSALDNYLRSRIEKLLIEVFLSYQGVTLFVTHKLEEAYRVCGNLIVLSQGQVIASGRKEDIFEHPPNFQVAQLTECKNFSLAQPIAHQQVQAIDWGCKLQIIEPIPHPLAYIGIRAHHLTFPLEPEGENTFPCSLVMLSETQHQMTLYLKLHNSTNREREYHLQAEVYKEKWANLKHRPFPWYVRLDPLRLMLMAH